jgi:hypothetical protein
VPGFLVQEHAVKETKSMVPTLHMTIRKSVIIILIGLAVASCNSVRDQWVLQSYDKAKGYTFLRNGVQYQATCVATGQPVLGLNPDAKPDLSPDALPPDIAQGQDSCADILVYLHKPIPNLRQVYSSLLLLTQERNQRIEFEIKQAK